MAVIAMYAEQVERLRQALGRRKFKRSVKIDTVDSFEGREEDLVVISLVRSNERGRIGFLRVPNRLNVAVSRARRLVAASAMPPPSAPARSSMYGVLVEAARESGGYISASEVVSPRRRNDRPFGTDAEAAVPARARGRAAIAGAAGPAPAPEPRCPPFSAPTGSRSLPRRARRGRWASPPGAAAGAGVGGGSSPETGAALPGAEGEAQRPEGEAAGPPTESQPSARSRRRRRRRHGPRPQGAAGIGAARTPRGRAGWRGEPRR